MTTEQLAIAEVGAGAQASPGRGWSAWLANVKQRRQLAREGRLEWIERQQRLERRKRESGEYVPDRWHHRYG